jgi:hypothetical protein
MFFIYIQELGNICRNDYRMEWYLFIFIMLGITICILVLYSNPHGYESGQMNTLHGSYTTPTLHGSYTKTPTPRPRLTPSSTPVSHPPYDTTKINSVDDYEYNMVMMNEGERDVSAATRKMLLSSYPMDWSTQPPSSSHFERGLANLKESFKNPSPIPNIYGNINGSTMTPPDSEEEKERRILNTYVPKKPSELTTYDAADAKELVDKIYASKGKVVSMKEVQPNVFSIMSVSDINAEEEAQATHGANEDSGENTIALPEITYSYKSSDPFFTQGERLRKDRIDYTQWTPGLERQFAPNTTMEHWY